MMINVTCLPHCHTPVVLSRHNPPMLTHQGLQLFKIYENTTNYGCHSLNILQNWLIYQETSVNIFFKFSNALPNFVQTSGAK